MSIPYLSSLWLIQRRRITSRDYVSGTTRTTKSSTMQQGHRPLSPLPFPNSSASSHLSSERAVYEFSSWRWPSTTNYCLKFLTEYAQLVHAILFAVATLRCGLLHLFCVCATPIRYVIDDAFVTTRQIWVFAATTWVCSLFIVSSPVIPGMDPATLLCKS